MNQPSRAPRRYLFLMLGLFGSLALTWPPAAQAQVVLSIANYSPAMPAPGSTGNQFDVVITNPIGSASAYTVQYFSFQLQVPALSGIMFTSVVRPSSGYIFGSYNPPAPPNDPFSFDTFPNTNFTASDPVTIPPPPSAVTIPNDGTSYLLGRVTYSVGGGVSPGAVIPVSFISAGTSLSDSMGGPIPFSSTNGSIQVGAAVPEPSTFALGGTIVGLVGLVAYRRRRRARAAASEGPNSP